MVQGTPLISVIIVNHNGIDFVEACLRSVLNNNYPKYEVILVDNASIDGSLEFARKNFGNDARMKFVENPSSVGPAVGRNRGAKKASGEYLAFLDNDTEVDKNWLVELVKVFEADNTIGAAQSKLLKTEPRNYFDCAGDYLNPLGFLVERSRGAEDKGQFDFIADILSAKSAASIIKRDLFEKIGGFDEDFYMYLEETDLSWRVWLSGNRVVFVPDSVVYHAYRTPKKEFKKYYTKYIVRYLGCRNYISTLIKNLGFFSLIKILPLQIASLSLLSLFFTLKGNLRDGFYVLKAIVWNISNIGLLSKKRNYINSKIRSVKDKDILNRLMVNKGLNYYFGKANAYLSGQSF